MTEGNAADTRVNIVGRIPINNTRTREPGPKTDDAHRGGHQAETYSGGGGISRPRSSSYGYTVFKFHHPKPSTPDTEIRTRLQSENFGLCRNGPVKSSRIASLSLGRRNRRRRGFEITLNVVGGGPWPGGWTTNFVGNFPTRTRRPRPEGDREFFFLFQRNVLSLSHTHAI